MKKPVNILLIIAIIVPNLLWPFTLSSWNFIRNLILHAVPALAAQILLCRTAERNFIKAIPAFVTGSTAAKILYIYLINPAYRINPESLEGVIANYLIPFLCCILVLVIFRLGKKPLFVS